MIIYTRPHDWFFSPQIQIPQGCPNRGHNKYGLLEEYMMDEIVKNIKDKKTNSKDRGGI